jgi:hypothetical protein
MDSLRERKAILVTTWTRVLHGLLLAGNERRRLSCEHEILIVGFVCLFVCLFVVFGDMNNIQEALSSFIGG